MSVEPQGLQILQLIDTDNSTPVVVLMLSEIHFKRI